MFTSEYMKVLDPLGGVGTIAFEACVQARIGFSNDLSPLAYCVATAKVSPATIDEVFSEVDLITRFMRKAVLSDADWEATKFGLNGTVADYFHKDTLTEILQARKYFLQKKKLSPAEAMVKASILHILHGNRPYALSRTSHPITPFQPSGDFVYKSLIEKLVKRITILLKEPLPSFFIKGKSFNMDFRKLPSAINDRVDTIITSPPFIGTRFDRQNWMRLWFCGWVANDFHETSKGFLDRQQMQSINVYRDFFSSAAHLLKVNGLLIIHLGHSGGVDMAKILADYSRPNFKHLATISENVEALEKHGVMDKGSTKAHQFVFFMNE
jgi:hypothetical protein